MIINRPNSYTKVSTSIIGDHMLKCQLWISISNLDSNVLLSTNHAICYRFLTLNCPARSTRKPHLLNSSRPMPVSGYPEGEVAWLLLCFINLRLWNSTVTTVQALVFGDWEWYSIAKLCSYGVRYFLFNTRDRFILPSCSHCGCKA